MKKVLFLLAAFVFCLQINGFSQKSRVGFSTGYTSSNMYGKIGGERVTDDPKSGISFGLLVDAPIGKSHISFQPSLNYVQKGRVTFNENTRANTLKEWIAIRYAELHANFLYNTNGPRGNWFIGGGPTFAVDLPSKKVSKTDALKTETNLNFGKESNSDLRGVDYGGNLLTGYRLKCGFFFAFNYTVGIRNLVPVQDGNDNNIRNHCWGIRVGLLINNK
ncbi:MAG: PorT family protein [Sphingobacteriales bacterium]|nr:PorT family protein [Sphingobacteriales bacterium]